MRAAKCLDARRSLLARELYAQATARVRLAPWRNDYAFAHDVHASAHDACVLRPFSLVLAQLSLVVARLRFVVGLKGPLLEDS